MNFSPPNIVEHRYYTQLRVEGQEISFHCTISNSYSTRNRRQLLLTIYDAIAPHLDFIKRSIIHHNHLQPPEIFGRDEFAQLSMKQCISIRDGNGELGYFIRGIRTKLGKTQKVFAEELGITSQYLSMIEKGHRTPSSKIVRKIHTMKPDV